MSYFPFLPVTPFPALVILASFFWFLMTSQTGTLFPSWFPENPFPDCPLLPGRMGPTPFFWKRLFSLRDSTFFSSTVIFSEWNPPLPKPAILPSLETARCLFFDPSSPHLEQRGFIFFPRTTSVFCPFHKRLAGSAIFFPRSGNAGLFSRECCFLPNSFAVLPPSFPFSVSSGRGALFEGGLTPPLLFPFLLQNLFFFFFWSWWKNYPLEVGIIVFPQSPFPPRQYGDSLPWRRLDPSPPAFPSPGEFLSFFSVSDD